MSFGFGFGMAKAAAFLSGPVPSLNLQFAGATTLDPRITFTRASSATYFNSSGVLTSAGNNVARFDYNPTTLAPRGLLIEEQRTNLLTYSEQFDNAAWGKTRSSISANATIAPDGALTADKLVEDTQTGGHLIEQTVAGIADSTTVTASVFAKAAERQWITIAVIGKDSSINRRWFNLSNGTAGSTDGTLVSSSITSVGNGWYRLTVVASVATGAGTPAVRINLGTADATPSYTGDGTSGIYIWGAQLEAGAFATSYIPTVAAQVTRSADSASMTGSNFSSWFNNSEGTIYAENTQAVVTGNVAFAYYIDDGAGANNSIYSDVNASRRRGVILSGGVAQAALSGNSTITTTSVVKSALVFKVNDFALSTDGTTVATDASGTVPSGMTRLFIGSNGALNAPLNAHIRKLAFYPTRLANATLQALTT